jgi:plasmid stability protein
MATLTIRDLDPEVKQRLRVRAAKNGRSMEEEVRVILKAASIESSNSGRGLADAIHARFAPFGGLELEIPPRELVRDPPDFK